MGSAAGTESGNQGGDPLSLVYLVQMCAVSGKLSNMPDTYVDGFAGSFAMFNLQMAPPRWAKSTVAGRRLMSWEDEINGVNINFPRVGPEDKRAIWAELQPAYAFGDDMTRGTEALKFHLFYMVPVFVGTVLVHWMLITVAFFLFAERLAACFQF